MEERHIATYISFVVQANDSTKAHHREAYIEYATKLLAPLSEEERGAIYEKADAFYASLGGSRPTHKGLYTDWEPLMDQVTLTKRIESAVRNYPEKDKYYLLAGYVNLLIINELTKHINKCVVHSPDPQYQLGAAAMKAQVLRILERAVK